MNRIDPNGLFQWENPITWWKNFLKSYVACAKRIASQANQKFTSDGMKHCWVSCEVARQCGLGILGSAGAGIWKEIEDMFGPGNAEFRDLLNDYEGLACTNQGGSCENCCKCKKLH